MTETEIAGSANNPLAACAHIATQSHYLRGPLDDLRYVTRSADAVAQADADAYRLFEHRITATLDYPCVMARSVVNRHSFRLATYGLLGDPKNAGILCHDLYEFCSEFRAPVVSAVSFIACFSSEEFDDEQAFETALWSQLQSAHDTDHRYFPWSAGVSASPSDPDFSFSIGGRAFFIVGMHSRSSRLARQMPFPMVVFNLHEQFVDLRTDGKFIGIRDKIRERDIALQGSVNPMSNDFGNRSEAAQYSGRATSTDWKCPFSAAQAG